MERQHTIDSRSYTEQIMHQVHDLQTELQQLAQIAPEQTLTRAALNTAWPPERMSHLARLRAAAAAIQLAASLLATDDPKQARELQEVLGQLNGQVKTWRRAGRGWFEMRWVRKTKIAMAKKESGETYTAGTRDEHYGPYRYFRWRDEDGKLQTIYLGKVQEGSEDLVTSPELLCGT